MGAHGTPSQCTLIKHYRAIQLITKAHWFIKNKIRATSKAFKLIIVNGNTRFLFKCQKGKSLIQIIAAENIANQPRAINARLFLSFSISSYRTVKLDPQQPGEWLRCYSHLYRAANKTWLFWLQTWREGAGSFALFVREQGHIPTHFLKRFIYRFRCRPTDRKLKASQSKQRRPFN